MKIGLRTYTASSWEDKTFTLGANIQSYVFQGNLTTSFTVDLGFWTVELELSIGID